MRRVLGAVAAFLMAGSAGAQTISGLDPENTLYLDLAYGRVVIEMYPEDAPNHVRRIKELVRQGFYDGLTFHRVIEGFMAQTGDPNGDGTGGSGQKLEAEFNDRLHMRGTVSMARSDDPNSADSQFFICLAPAFHLDGKYTVWGRVVSGMEFVDQIKRGEGPSFVENGEPDRILRLRVAADVEQAENLEPAGELGADAGS
ncbi:MAG: peptidylprolyl isomerase [Alphaproteobacteria bacterium]|nr:MAG: peptidylprolyl isomerase [Alphaproteobacteria bacterium]